MPHYLVLRFTIFSRRLVHEEKEKVKEKKELVRFKCIYCFAKIQKACTRSAI